MLINTYPLANPKGIFYIEGIIFIGKECPTVLTKLGGTYSERFSGVDTICLQLLDWLCSNPPYAEFFCNTTKYSIFQIEELLLIWKQRMLSRIQCCQKHQSLQIFMALNISKKNLFKFCKKKNLVFSFFFFSGRAGIFFWSFGMQNKV